MQRQRADVAEKTKIRSFFRSLGIVVMMTVATLAVLEVFVLEVGTVGVTTGICGAIKGTDPFSQQQRCFCAQAAIVLRKLGQSP